MTIHRGSIIEEHSYARDCQRCCQCILRIPSVSHVPALRPSLSEPCSAPWPPRTCCCRIPFCRGLVREASSCRARKDATVRQTLDWESASRLQREPPRDASSQCSTRVRCYVIGKGFNDSNMRFAECKWARSKTLSRQHEGRYALTCQKLRRC